MGNKSSSFVNPYEQFTGLVTLGYFGHEVEDVDGSRYSLRRIPFEAVPDFCDFVNKQPSNNHFNLHSKHWYTTVIHSKLPNTELYFLCAQVDPFLNPGFTEADIPRPVKGKLPRLELLQLQARSFRSVIHLDEHGEGVNANKGSPDYSKYPNPSYHILLFYYYDAEDTVHAMHTTAIHLSSTNDGPEHGIEETFDTSPLPTSPSGRRKHTMPSVSPSNKTLNSQSTTMDCLGSKSTTSVNTSRSSASSSSPKLGKRDKIKKMFLHGSGSTGPTGSPKSGKRERLLSLLPGTSSTDLSAATTAQNTTERPNAKAILNCRARILQSSPLFAHMSTAGTWDLQQDREIQSETKEVAHHRAALERHQTIAKDYAAQLELTPRHKAIYYLMISVQCILLLYLTYMYVTQYLQLHKLGVHYVIVS